MPPPVPVVACPDGGGPSFEGEVLPIFKNVCDNCHAPDASDPQTPLLTNYQQIHGPTIAGEINTRVFDDCSMPMPPSTAPVQLSGDDRQTLLVWLACGALDSPAVDAGGD